MLLEIKFGSRKRLGSRGNPPRVCVLKCDVCGNVYERNYSYHKLKVHRCSKSCVYGHRSTDGLGGHGGAVREESCGSCGKTVRAQASAAGGKHVFCDMACYAQWRSDHPETYAENTSAMHTPEAARKISQRARERMSDPDYVHPMQGKHLSEDARKKIKAAHATNPMVGEKNGMYGRKHTREVKEVMSRKHADLLVKKKVRPYGGNSRKGSYTSIKTGREHWFRSGWEEAVMRYLDASDDVTDWDHEWVRIPYYYNENRRWYVPDFLVTRRDGSRELWEVKPKEFMGSQRSQLKLEAAQGWCVENDIIGCCILTGDELRTMGVI